MEGVEPIREAQPPYIMNIIGERELANLVV